ncbi:MAG: hypothetical protein Q9M91_02165 [Candidatus Dojkabacteria bacterium]|nr:hypothetical protein [Candidatus Dojkabacteria bacterium]
MTRILTNKIIIENANIMKMIESVEDSYRNIDKYGIPPRFFANTKNGGDYLVAACTNLTNDTFIIRGSDFTPGRTPTVMGHFMYKSYATGELLAIADGAELINYRTGAKAAVAAKYLARKNSETLGLTGFYESVKVHAECMKALFPLRKKGVLDRKSNGAIKLY